MILRRILERVKRQHWSTLFFELGIVVVGVFLGLQVDNWNSDRHTRALEQEYIERLHADMDYTLASRDKVSGWDDERLAGQALILAALRSGTLADGDRAAFDQSLLLFGFIGWPDVRWATMEELESTGSMSIISDVALRSLLGRMDAELKRRQALSLSFTNSINAFRQQIGHRFGVLEFTDLTEPVTLDYDFAGLASDTGFINTLSQIDTLSRIKFRNTRAEMDDIRALRDELAKRLPPDKDSAR
ncbi:MAG: hypothetical protein R3F12_03930 [Lysobacteraceae bacterium]|nr:hypothetical protein [Xanthomonadaceae bacterium]HRX98803.1 hypothetical protein [Xanthomonadaceae bacterium]